MHYTQKLKDIFEVRLASSQSILNRARDVIGNENKHNKKTRIDNNNINEYKNYWYIVINNEIHISAHRRKLVKYADDRKVKAKASKISTNCKKLLQVGYVINHD